MQSVIFNLNQFVMNAIDQKIYATAIANGLNPTIAAIVIAQARYETEDYTSNVFKQNNNLFGYKYVGQSLAVQGTPVPGSEQSTGPKYYAKYSTVEDSVKELVEWIRRRVDGKQFAMQELTTPEGYAAGFGRLPYRYFGVSVSQYAAGLRAKLQTLGDAAGPVVEAANTATGGKIVFAVVVLLLLGSTIFVRSTAGNR